MSRDDARPSRGIEGLPSPLSELPWSSDFVMQGIEILPILLRNGAILAHRPDHAESFVVGWPAGERPEEIAARSLERLGLRPRAIHSTSWRHAGDEVVLTYLAVVDPDAAAPPSWSTVPVARAELARGDATAPPPAIGLAQVLEHALRHLAWLLRDDPAIAAAVAEWEAVLSEYVPEPFRAFGEPRRP